jgi:hypothetical protein
MVSRPLIGLALCALCLTATSVNAQIANPRLSLAGLLHCLAMGLPLAFGTLFYADHAIAMSGGDAHFAYLHRLGVDVVTTDRHHHAFAAIDQVASVKNALRLCGAAGD